MNKKHFLDNYVLPHIAKINGKYDKPYNRQVFHAAKDALHKDGLITEWQVQNWIYPKTKMFE